MSAGPDAVAARMSEALKDSGGVYGAGPAMEGAHQIARRTGATAHELLVVLGSEADDALACWG